MRKLLLAAVAAIALVCPRAALADNPFSAGLTISPVTINAQCSTPTSGCAAGQFASVSVNGRNSVTAQVVTSNFSGTLTPYFSVDGGTTWVATLLRNGPGLPGATSTGSVLAASTATIQYVIIIPYGGATDVMLASTAAVTNTATVQLTPSNSNTNLATWATVKGTQGSQGTGISTQDLKDAGRTFVAVDIDNYTLTAADAVMTFSQNKAGTVTGGLTTYAITSAKTLRLQELHCTLRQSSVTAASATVRLRLNTGGACIVGSGLVQSFSLIAPTGTSAAEVGEANLVVPFPDGLELSGASWNICLSAVGSTANGTLVCGLTGYEY